jgi:single-strand DNA-binding protein
MARGTVNKVILVGRLGSDPEIRYAASGTAVARFNLATNEAVSAGEGKWEERTEWHRVVAFARLAENCGQFLAKGKQVYVEGSLRTQQWEDSQGNKRWTTEVIARDIQFLGGGGAPANTTSSALPGSEPQQSMADSGPESLPPRSGFPEDDIPF